MDSNKSSKRRPAERGVVEPQRRHGKERVATVLEVAAAVFAEKGYEAATMAEIASRAKSPIGSLYRFFPNKELLAEALVEGYRATVEETFGKIDELAKAGKVEATADALLNFAIDLRPQTKALLAFMEAKPDASVKRTEIRKVALRHIADTVMLLAPRMAREMAENVAMVLLLNMKSMARLRTENPEALGAMDELKRMNRLYVESRVMDAISASVKRP